MIARLAVRATAIRRQRAEQQLPRHFDLHIDQVLFYPSRIDLDAQAGCIGSGNFGVLVADYVVPRELQCYRLRGERELREPMLLQARVGLQRGTEREMRRESMVHERHAVRDRVVGDLFRRTNSADTTGVDLDEADTAVVDQMPRHVEVMSSLAACQPHLLAACGQRAVRLQCVPAERFL